MPKTRLVMSGPCAHLLLDDSAEKLNTLGAEMISEIGAQVAALKADPAVKTIVIRSAKPSGFLAGANLNELQALSNSKDPVADGIQAAKAGQALMNAIEDCGKPTVAAIHGPALGGGCELALACTARVAALDSAKIGLPEIQLGILPGFGGSWRLPRLLTTPAALPLILASTQLDARRALKVGLVDDVCPLEQLGAVAEALALDLVSPEGASRLGLKRRSKRSRLNRVLDLPFLRPIVFSQARKEVLAKTKGAYPAPLKVLALIAGHSADRTASLQREAQALGELLATEVSRNLVRLFFLGQGAKKQAGEGKAAKVRGVAVVGAGFMGSGIAIPLVTRAKLPTLLKESNLEVLGRALKKVKDYLSKGVAKRRLLPVQAVQQFDLLSPGAGADLGGVDLVIEAVPEVLDLKRKVFAELESLLPADAVIATNTSTIPIADLSAAAKDPPRYIGMHFFSPAEVMPLVEVIPSSKTSPEALATVVDLALKMGKTPVVVKDSPGFLVNRILLPYMGEAAQMVQEGVPYEQVDKAALDFGMPVGPIKLIGEVGVEVTVKVYHLLLPHFGDHMPKPAWLERADLKDAFVRGADGKLNVDGAKISAWVGKPDPGLRPSEIGDRLFQSLINEAARCLDEGVVKDPGLLDLGLVYGTGFPPYRGGLLREAEARGVKAVAERGAALAAKHGAPWLEPPKALKDKERFYS